MTRATRREFLVALAALLAGACARGVESEPAPAPSPTTAPFASTIPPPSTTASPSATTTTAPAPATTAPPTSTGPTVPTPTTAKPAAEIILAGRDAWGARPALPERLQHHSDGLQLVTVHHAGDTETATGPRRYRTWQNWHIDDRGWGDIAYHFLIGTDGTVYRGRDLTYRGDTATSYDPDGHFLVVVEGNFDREQPTPQQLEVLPMLVAWAVGTHRIPAAGIGGHRDYASTSCPGAALYPYISSGQLRTDVEELLAAGGVRTG